MKAQSEIRKSVITIAFVFGMILVGGFQFYVGLANEYGVDFADRSDLAQDEFLITLSEDLRQDAEAIKEESVGGFNLVRGLISFVKTLYNSVDLVSGTASSVLSSIGAPTFITDNVNFIIIFTLLASGYAIIKGTKSA